MRSLFLLITICIVVFTPAFAQNGSTLAGTFRALPDEYRPIPLWFWNDSEVHKEELTEQLKQIKRTGYGGVSILPFGKGFKPEYLSDAYFDVYKSCIKEAQRQGLKMHIYDEYGFPSGTAGDINGDGIGRFKKRYPQHTNKRLDKSEYPVTNKGNFRLEIAQENLMGIVAMDTVNLNRIDITPLVHGGILKWNVPGGAWKIMAFHCVDAENSIVDYLDPQAADLFIGMTHQAYYDRFSSYFGNVVEGTFFDEPTMYYANGRTWTPKFNERFEKRYGYSPVLFYPALWQDIGEQTTAARNMLHSFRSDLFASGYIKHVNQWSREHGVYATGHLDNEEILNAVGTSGDYMKAFKYLDAPGIDKIGGDRPTEEFYKLISSAAYNWDKHLVMSETYGDMGNISWNEMFGIAMEQYAKGINMLIPHAVWFNDKNVTFLPELSLRNPVYADSLKTFNDYLTRLNVMLRNEGTWAGDIAVLYPIHSMQGDHYFEGPLDYYKGGVELDYLDYTKVGATLYDSLGHDFMYMHPEVLDEKCHVEGANLALNNTRQKADFSVLVVPAMNSISQSNLKKARDFARGGGVVLFTSQLPHKSALNSDDVVVNHTISEMLKLPNVYFVQDPSKENMAAVLKKTRSFI